MDEPPSQATAASTLIVLISLLPVLAMYVHAMLDSANPTVESAILVMTAHFETPL